jgi:hypothetical protein
MSLTIEDAFIAALLAHDALTAIVADRIYVGEAPDDLDDGGSLEPLVTVQVITDPPDRFLGGLAEIDAQVQVTIFGAYQDQVTAKQAAAEVVAALDNQTLVVAGDNASCQCLDRPVADIDDDRLTLISLWRVISPAAF